MNTIYSKEIVDSLPIPAFVLDISHKVVFWNHACKRLTGISEDEIVGTSNHWKGFYSQKRKILADVMFSKNLHEELDKHYPGKWSISKHDSNRIKVLDYFPNFSSKGKWLYFICTLIKDKDGEVAGVIETFQDMTDKVEAEKEIENRNKKLHELNITLSNMLGIAQKEKESIEQSVSYNVSKNILPEIDRLLVRAPNLKNQIDLIKQELEDICSNHSKKLIDANYSMTPAEQRILQFVRKGYRDKEIANFLHVALATVKKHKISIRKKLNISNTKIRIEQHLNNTLLDI